MPNTVALPPMELAPAALLAGPVVHLPRTQGHLVFQSLLISVGLGATVMGVAATSADGAGQLARSSGRMAVAAFDRTAMFNRRFQLTDRLLEGARVTGCRLREFDEEHAVVHRATESAKKAWLGLQQYDEAHGLTARAGAALASGLDTLTEFLTPPPPNTRQRGERSSNSKNKSNVARNNSPEQKRSGASSSARRRGAAARGGAEVDGWSWLRERLVNGEAGRGRRGGTGLGGERWSWRPEMGGGGRGGEGGRKQQQRSLQRQREEDRSRSWRILGTDEEL
eukprot:g12083.t1